MCRHVALNQRIPVACRRRSATGELYAAAHGAQHVADQPASSRREIGRNYDEIIVAHDPGE
jgi:hypothetical protein